MTLWKWLYNEKKETLYTVGIYKDGTLRNPNGYPEDEVRAACEKDPDVVSFKVDPCLRQQMSRNPN
jgi:hypothetical protein